MLCQRCCAELRRELLLLVASCGLCACSSGLASLDDRTVRIFLQQSDLRVSIWYDWGGEGSSRCITLHELKGSLNGTPLEVTTPGHRYDGHPEPTCELPELKLSAAEFPNSLAGNIRISDDSMEIKVDLPTLFAPRTTSIASQTPGQMYPDEEVVLSWTPESDFVPHGDPLCIFRSDTNREVFESSPFLPQSACRYGVCDEHVSLIDPQHIRLRVPTPDGSAGSLPISGTLSPVSLSMAIDLCDGAKCSPPVLDHHVQITLVAAP